MPKVKISQNLFLAGDVNAKKKSESPVDPGANEASVTSLSRAQTRHNLNIDDPTSNEIDLCFRSGPDSCDNDDNVAGPDRSTGLENELPESPAYRSPLLSDSEAECEDQGSTASSRHHVLEAFVG